MAPSGGLVERLPRRPRDGEQRRFLLVTPKIYELLDGKPPHATLAPKLADLLIADFCAGYMVTVSKRKARSKREEKKKRPAFERLEGFDEIWVMCDRSLKPGWRLLGRFVEAGTLVILKGWPKEAISSTYEKEANEILDAWRNILGDTTPFRSDKIDVYFNGNVRDVDEEV